MVTRTAGLLARLTAAVLLAAGLAACSGLFGDRKIAENAVPEHHSLLRTLQCVVEYRRKVFATLR